MIDTSKVISGASAIVIACAVACSGASANSGPVLQGVYRATSPGPISVIAFADGQYTLETDKCSGGATSCTEEGTFVVDGDNVDLTDSVTGKTETLPFAVVTSGDFQSLDLNVRLMGLRITNGGGDGGGGTALTTGSGTTLSTSSGTPLATCTNGCALTVTVGGQTFTLTGQQITLFSQNNGSGSGS